MTIAFADGDIIDPNTGDEMPLFAVIVATIVWTLVAIGVYWLVVQRLCRPATYYQATFAIITASLTGLNLLRRWAA